MINEFMDSQIEFMFLSNSSFLVVLACSCRSILLRINLKKIVISITNRKKQR